MTVITPKRPPWTPPADIPRILVDPQRYTPQAGQDAYLQRCRRFQWTLRTAREVLRAAITYFRPVRTYLCFSGGYDSAAAVLVGLTSLHWDRTLVPAGPDVCVLHINTGIGIEATRQYVRDFCADRNVPYLEVKTPESYEEMVLAHGFPGPGMHAKMYQRLKERAIRIAVRRAKEGHPRSATVLLVSGVRHDESQRRTGYQRCISKVDSQVWVNPLYWSTAADFRTIRDYYDLPPNPVKDALGMSGECGCGAYAHKGELAIWERVDPEFGRRIRDLERRARAAGHDWGWEDAPARKPGHEPELPAEEDVGPMCANCEKNRSTGCGTAVLAVIREQSLREELRERLRRLRERRRQ